MSDFYITETPTLHFVATGDEQKLSHDLQARLDEALRQAGENPDVTAAAERNRAAGDRVQQLKRAERTLHRTARESSLELTETTTRALDKIIYSETPDFSGIENLAVIEARNRYTSRALERVVEHLLPLSHIAQLRAESHELVVRARAIEAIAQERAERLRSQLRDAVSEEIVLPVDISKGVAGALLAHAVELKKLAVQQSENADRIEKSYTARGNKEISR